MVKLEEIPEYIRQDLTERFDNDIKRLQVFCVAANAREVLDEWLSYQGIIRWTGRILDAWGAIRRAEVLRGSIGDSFDKQINITSSDEVQIQISCDGKRLWVCTKYGTKLRIQGIKHLTIVDDRPSRDQNLDT